MPEQSAQSEYWDPHHNELCYGGVTVAQFQTEEECDFAVHLLRERGIRSGVLLPERRLDLRSPQVRVSPEDEQVARDILAQPVTARKESGVLCRAGMRVILTSLLLKMRLLRGRP